MVNGNYQDVSCAAGFPCTLNHSQYAVRTYPFTQSVLFPSFSRESPGGIRLPSRTIHPGTRFAKTAFYAVLLID